MATGDTIAKFSPLHNEPPAASPMTFDTRNAHPVLDADGTTNESAVFSDVMPRHYSGCGVTTYLHFAMSISASGDVDLDVAFERIGEIQDLDSDGFAAAQSVDNTTVASVIGEITIASLAHTEGAQMDSIAVGEGYRLKVTRDGANDTAGGDMELRFVEIKET